MYWANFLHIYQPPTQTEEIVRKVTDESYRKLVDVLDQFPSAKITLNINGSLTEQLARYRLIDVIQGFRRLAERGQVEFTGSAIYHPILPLIPEREIRRQIELNTALNRSFFGEVYNPQGFFPPEMCYSRRVAEIVADMGYKWIIVDEISYNGKLGTVSDDTTYSVRSLHDFRVFFKERPFSAGITYGSLPTGKEFVQALGNRIGENRYLLTGTDGEVYGHHRPGQEQLLRDVFGQQRPASGAPTQTSHTDNQAQGEIETCTISELISLFNKKETADPLPSSWSTWEDEMALGIPYPQWIYPGNEIHRLQWELTNLAIDSLTAVSPAAEGYEEARRTLDEGLHSCQYWWASCRPWWDTGMIERGAILLARAVSLAADALAQGQSLRAAKLSEEITRTAQEWQATGKAKGLKEQYLREHKDVTSELTFG
ncbi:MAG: hypothetical protein M1343_02135 [Chloroflexi bacterium]|nr:hypothetical protein [Chloroflexota bacterium]